MKANSMSAAAAVIGFFATLGPRDSGQPSARDPLESRTPVLDRIRGAVAVAIVAAALAPGSASAQSLGVNAPSIMGILGAVGGAYGGSQIGSGSGKTAAIAVGTLLGAGLGWEGGKYLDRQSQAAQQALSQAQLGQRVSWQDQGAAGYYMPVREGVSMQTGLQCREYQTEIVVGGQRQTGFGTACLQPDGSWRIQSAGEHRQGAQFQAPSYGAAPPHYAAPGYGAPAPAYYAGNNGQTVFGR